MAYKINKKFPYIGYDFIGKRYNLIDKKDGYMGKLYNGSWKHFVKIEDNIYWEKNIHFSENGKLPTLCGKNNNSTFLVYTKNKNNVTCKFCLSKMKELYYFCDKHGFIDMIDVTFDEKCDYCEKIH